MAELVREHGFKQCAEIGVWRGEGTVGMLRAGAEHVLMVDPMNAELNDSFECRMREPRKNQEELDAMCSELEQVPDTTFLRLTSMEAVNMVKDKSLDFVYIDGMHTYEALKKDILAWRKKVKKGGMIAGDDFERHTELGRAVLEVYPNVLNEEQVWYQSL